LSLIIARTKKGTIASVIFGVAIATALMPPLCTVGYGLAAAVTGNSQGLKFAAGAMYLFIINTIFIALATFLVLKLLRFPMIKYANSKRRNNISRFASFLAILVMVPAGFTFVSVLRESAFNNNAKLFIERELNGLPNSSYLKKYATYDFSDNDISTIELTSFGADQIGESTMGLLRNRLLDYKALANTKLVLNQSSRDDSFQDEVRYMEELRSRDSLDLLTKDQKIVYLEERMSKLLRLEENIIPFQEICIEAKINYENLETISYASTLRSNFNTIDTLAVFNVTWDAAISKENKTKDMKKLYEWLKYKIKLDTLILK
jgi:ligand-binding SRPBCC domain-containing protein